MAAPPASLGSAEKLQEGPRFLALIRMKRDTPKVGLQVNTLNTGVTFGFCWADAEAAQLRSGRGRGADFLDGLGFAGLLSCSALASTVPFQHHPVPAP